MKENISCVYSETNCFVLMPVEENNRGTNSNRTAEERRQGKAIFFEKRRTPSEVRYKFKKTREYNTDKLKKGRRMTKKKT